MADEFGIPMDQILNTLPGYQPPPSFGGQYPNPALSASLPPEEETMSMDEILAQYTGALQVPDIPSPDVTEEERMRIRQDVGLDRGKGSTIAEIISNFLTTMTADDPSGRAASLLSTQAQRKASRQFEASRSIRELEKMRKEQAIQAQRDRIVAENRRAENILSARTTMARDSKARTHEGNMKILESELQRSRDAGLFDQRKEEILFNHKLDQDDALKEHLNELDILAKTHTYNKALQDQRTDAERSLQKIDLRQVYNSYGLTATEEIVDYLVDGKRMSNTAQQEFDNFQASPRNPNSLAAFRGKFIMDRIDSYKDSPHAAFNKNPFWWAEQDYKRFTGDPTAAKIDGDPVRVQLALDLEDNNYDFDKVESLYKGTPEENQVKIYLNELREVKDIEQVIAGSWKLKFASAVLGPETVKMGVGWARSVGQATSFQPSRVAGAALTAGLHQDPNQRTAHEAYGEVGRNLTRKAGRAVDQVISALPDMSQDPNQATATEAFERTNRNLQGVRDNILAGTGQAFQTLKSEAVQATQDLANLANSGLSEIGQLNQLAGQYPRQIMDALYVAGNWLGGKSKAALDALIQDYEERKTINIGQLNEVLAGGENVARQILNQLEDNLLFITDPDFRNQFAVPDLSPKVGAFGQVQELGARAGRNARFRDQMRRPQVENLPLGGRTISELSNAPSIPAEFVNPLTGEFKDKELEERFQIFNSTGTTEQGLY